MNKKHSIPLGSLVEIVYEDSSSTYREEMGHGLRLYVVQHSYDCDGSPLYSLSFDKEAGEEVEQLNTKVIAKDFENALDEAAIKAMQWYYKGRLMTGYDEGTIKVLTSPVKEQQ